jgi:hypothetical protein
MIKFRSFHPLDLDEDEWSASRSGHLTPSIHCRGDWELQSHFDHGSEETNSSPYQKYDLERSNTGIMGLNMARGMDVCHSHYD